MTNNLRQRNTVVKYGTVPYRTGDTQKLFRNGGSLLLESGMILRKQRP